MVQSYERVNNGQSSSSEPSDDPLVSAFSSEDSDDVTAPLTNSAVETGADGSTPTIYGNSRRSSLDTNNNGASAPNSSSGEACDSSAASIGSSGSDSRPSSRWTGLLNRITRGRPSRQETPSSRVTEINDEQDGVFGNLLAKEETNNGESTQEPPSGPPPDAFGSFDDDISPPDQPPSYEEASADATPSYWETTILTSGWDDEIVVGDMPVGSIMAFAWSMLVSSAFSYIGFFLTYFFHMSHASRSGSLAGLGLTLMHASFDLVPTETVAPSGDPVQYAPSNPNNFEDGAPIGILVHPTEQSVHSHDPSPSKHSKLTSNLVFFLGLVIFIKGILEYLMACRLQSAILRRMHNEENAAAAAQEESEENNTEQAGQQPTAAPLPVTIVTPPDAESVPVRPLNEP